MIKSGFLMVDRAFIDPYRSVSVFILIIELSLSSKQHIDTLCFFLDHRIVMCDFLVWQQGSQSCSPFKCYLWFTANMRMYMQLYT